jgi:LPXTG-motif cell wall-anchored protein
VAWPAQANLPTDATYVSQQTGGPTLLPCKASGSRGSGSAANGGGPGSGSPTTVAGNGSASGLPNTGSRPALAIVGLVLALVAGALLVLRRRTDG